VPVALRAPTRRLHDQKLKNRRSLGAIAADIHNLQRKNVFAIGKLLLEAKEACDHGEWMPWLYDEFAWSEDSAQRFIGIARLGLKFRKLRNLKLAKTTLYNLADLAKAANETELAAIVPALAKHATRKHLKPADAAKIIELVQLRQRFGSGL
jgi:DUF3102 family protein